MMPDHHSVAERTLARRKQPTQAEIEQRKRELAEEWLEHPDNAQEALSESLLSHRNLWGSAHGSLVDRDDMALGMMVRVALLNYAESITSRKLENWLDRFGIEGA